VNFLLMLLQRVYHRLGQLTNSPDPNFSFLPTGHNPGAVTGASHSSNSIDMGIIDDKHLLSGLGVEGTDLSIAPARDDAFSITHESDRVALTIGVVDS
jgi:hypothetical protein